MLVQKKLTVIPATIDLRLCGIKEPLEVAKYFHLRTNR